MEWQEQTGEGNPKRQFDGRLGHDNADDKTTKGGTHILRCQKIIKERVKYSDTNTLRFMDQNLL